MKKTALKHQPEEQKQRLPHAGKMYFNLHLRSEQLKTCTSASFVPVFYGKQTSVMTLPLLIWVGKVIFFHSTFS